MLNSDGQNRLERKSCHESMVRPNENDIFIDRTKYWGSKPDRYYHVARLDRARKFSVPLTIARLWGDDVTISLSIREVGGHGP